MDKVCIRCGKAFRVPPSRHAARYCNIACLHAVQRGPDNPNWKGGLVTTPCLICGVPVSVKPSHRKYGEGKTCSRKCKGAWQSKIRKGQGVTRVEKQCQVCGKTVAVKRSHAGIEGSYCSVACMQVGYRERFNGTDNPHWIDGRALHPDYAVVMGRIRKTRETQAGGSHTPQEWDALKAQYNYTCLRCGRQEPEITLTFDHVVPVTMGGSSDISNGQPLCRSCNSRKNAKNIDYRPETQCSPTTNTPR